MLPLSCSDSPSGPTTGRNKYNFYGLDNLTSNGTGILRFDPANGVIDTVFDSLPRVRGWSLSADGEALYASMNDSLVVFASYDGSHISTIELACGAASASPDGRLLYLATGELSYLLNLPSYQMLHDLSDLKVAGGVWSRDSKTLYCLGAGATVPTVKRVQFGEQVEMDSVTIPGMPGFLVDMKPSIDERLLFLYSRFGSFQCAFGVYDIAVDSLIYRMELVPGAGWIAVAADGRTVLFTNPGTQLIGPPAPSAFYLYDIPSNSVKEYSTEGIAGGEDEPWLYRMPIGPLAITPDGRTAVLSRAVIGTDLLVFDIPSRSIVKYCDFDYKASFLNVSCQNGK